MFAHKETPCLSDDCLPGQFAQFERGQPNIVVDSVGWVFGIPNRILLWNWDVENHDISAETERQLQQYVATNGLNDVKVRLNQYDPGGEWQRLARNKRVGAGWRYTVGAVSTLGYTVFPGRLFGRDNYNPFTNTVNVYSDVPALGIKETAYAADVTGRDLPGTYAFSQLLPGVSLVHETITTRDALEYVDATGDRATREEAVHVLYPSYGGSVGGAIDSFVPAAGSAFQLGGTLVGHVSGRWETRGWGTTGNAPLMSANADGVPPQNELAEADAEADATTLAKTHNASVAEADTTQTAANDRKPASKVVNASYEEPAATTE